MTFLVSFSCYDLSWEEPYISFFLKAGSEDKCWWADKNHWENLIVTYSGNFVPVQFTTQAQVHFVFPPYFSQCFIMLEMRACSLYQRWRRSLENTSLQPSKTYDQLIPYLGLFSDPLKLSCRPWTKELWSGWNQSFRDKKSTHQKKQMFNSQVHDKLGSNTYFPVSLWFIFPCLSSGIYASLY